MSPPNQVMPSISITIRMIQTRFSPVCPERLAKYTAVAIFQRKRARHAGFPALTEIYQFRHPETCRIQGNQVRLVRPLGIGKTPAQEFRLLSIITKTARIACDRIRWTAEVRASSPDSDFREFIGTTPSVAFSLALLAALQVQAQDLVDVPLDRLRQADIVILGEVHDNPHHHEGQAALIRRIAPRSVVFEMLSDRQAALVRVDRDTDFEALAETIGWAEGGWPDFDLYRPVFAALQGISVFGAAAKPENVRRAVLTGAAAVFGDRAELFGLDRNLRESQARARRQLQFEAHCRAVPEDRLDAMVEAQRYRDAVFADAVLRALDSEGAPVVLITGSGHARRDWAVPALIAKARPDADVVALAFLERGADQDIRNRFDFTVITDPAERTDPCARFAG